uniref:Uma2 family endonuclease n=1 Tax=Trichocoleus desertorum TaxID=1481672 RepID=UPI0025B56C16|nr:Uma2 family endonuclease [Trichocoleus desertorum]
MAVQLLRRQFTVTQYHQMVEAGILAEDDRVELIEGEIIEMSPIGRRHAACVNRLVRLFSERLGDRVIVAAQNPVELSDRSEPQPDVALLQPRPDFYEAGHPQPQDILLLVEVADTTVEFDREIKIPLYAKSGVREVWLVDLNQNAIAVYREPSLSGYAQVQQLQRGQMLTVQAITDVSLAVEKLLGQGNNFS